MRTRPRAGSQSFSPPRTASICCHPDVKEQNGLEVPRALQWVKWQAGGGGEFAKALVVKNVSTEVIPFSYKLLPHGSPFSVEFPELRRLSPGMSATIKVLFRPPARQRFCEQLEVLSGATSIYVALSAVLPASKLQLPPGGLDFGCVPVRQPCLQQLPITNVGDAPLSFAWRVQQPFAVVPATGQLAPGQTLVCEVRFHPQEAAAYRVAVACSLDNGELLTVQVSGMAKFPFLSLERECIDCGSVVVGQTAEAFVRFGNHSPVPAAFAVTSAAGCQDGTLSVQPQRGTLQPNEYSLLRVTFAPRATGTFSCQSFSLACAGGNSLALTCQGTAAGPALRLSGRVFAFGSVRSGQAVPPKALYLDNASDVPLHYQFLAEPGGVFELSRAAGVIPPRSMTHAAIYFAAGARPGNYWQRIVCLVKDSEPQAIDVLASCFDDTSRPPPLSYKHIRAQLDRAAVVSQPDGGSSSLQASGEQQQQPGGCLRGSTSSSMGSRGSAGSLQQVGQYRSRSGEDAGAPLIVQQQQRQQQLAGPDSWRLLFEGLGATGLPAVTVSERFLDFGCCSKLSPSAPRSFQVTNITAAKLTVSMLVPTWADPVVPGGAAPQQQVFTAFPESLELRPQASGTIHVAFRPPRDGQYYSQTLVVQSSVKAMRSFRLVQDDAVVPPWRTGILASGRTFAAVNPELAPKVSLSTSSISFPPCRLGEAVHQTLCLTNSGDTPAYFAFAAAARGSSAPAAAAAGGGSSGQGAEAGSSLGAGMWFGAQFAVLPVQGVLEPKSQCLVALRFQPASLAPAELRLACVFNHSTCSSAALLLLGAASEPQLALDLSSSRLFFRPTCVGAASQRQLTVRNVSRVPVGWQWVLSRKLQDAVTVEPMAGVLRGLEAARVTVTFAPDKSGVFDARAALLMLPPDAFSDAAPTVEAAGCQDSSLTGRAASAAAYGEAAAAEAAAGLDDSQQQQLDAGAYVSTSSSPYSAANKLILAIVGEATQGALAITPASIAFGSISVGHLRTQALALVNQSSGVLRYRLCIVDDNPQGGVDAADAACEFSSPASVLGAGLALGGDGGERCSSACQADCWVDAPEGTINPRASKTLQLTILPRRRGAYRLQLNLHAAVPHSAPAAGSLRGVPVQQQPCSGALEGSATARSPRKQHSLVMRHSKSASSTHLRPLSCRPEAAAAGADADRGFSKQGSAAAAAGSVDAIRAVHSTSSAGGSPVAAAAALAPSWRADAPPLATAAVTADASFPSLLLTDVFCEATPKQVAWQLLRVMQLNEELRAAVSAAEVQVQVLADRGQLSNDNAAVLLPPFQLDLGVAAAGGSARSFWVTFANAGVLPLQWELHSYDAPQVDLENWVEAAKPLTQAERERAFIIDNKVFEVLPHAGMLQQGQVQQVYLRFNPVAEGSFCLPLFLRVKDGKQLQLQLNGQAVAPAAQLALAVRGSHSCLLAPAPIGELQAPLQQYTLRNGGPAPLAYSLDTSPLQQLARQNYAAEVIKFAGGSPLSGEVPVGGAAVFNWLFQPLEAKEYSVALPLTLGGGSSTPQPLLLHGRGYHPTSQPEAAAPNAAEAAQHWQGWLGFSAHPTAHEAPAAAWDWGSAAGRCLLSSPEVLDLGVVLPAGTCKQLLTLSNAAAAPVAFAWQLRVFEAARGIISGRLAITPASGVLQPGEVRLCQVSFEAGLAPQLFSGEVYCQAVPAPADDDDIGSGPGSVGGVGAHGLTLQQWQQLRDGDGQPDGEASGEVFAQHPPRQVLPVFGCKLRQRLPLHLSMTEAVCNRFDALRQQFQQATATLRDGSGAPQSLQQQGAASGNGSCEQAPQLVGPQLLAVTLQGAVLNKAHINAGSYLRGPQELQRARRLLPVAHLLPSVQHPVSLLPAPGSLGTSAAAAAAAKAAAEAADASGPDCDEETPLAQAVGAVLQELLTDVWGEEDVVAAFDSLAPVPTLAQLVQQQQQQQQVQVDAAEAPVAGAAAAAGGSPAVAALLAEPALAAFAEFVVLDSALLGVLQEQAACGRQGVMEG